MAARGLIRQPFLVGSPLLCIFLQVSFVEHTEVGGSRSVFRGGSL